ncbi:hypothetical protein TruAng_006410 [Truncatella angustata]|nr:hypothetical protein TruAng_006410 [Truncatella angustata]
MRQMSTRVSRLCLHGRKARRSFLSSSTADSGQEPDASKGTSLETQPTCRPRRTSESIRRVSRRDGDTLDLIDKPDSCSDTTRSSQPEQSGSSKGLTNAMMRTVVSNENDALNILFEAAQHEAEIQSDRGSVGRENDDVSQASRMVGIMAEAAVAHQTPNFSTIFSQPNELTTLSSPVPDVVRIWNAYRFVVMGWFSAEEAVTLVDAFFRNMSPLSPVLDEFYADHANHYHLITREPMLCCMILTISSRYHTLPAIGGQSRGHLMHQRLWEYCQNLLLRLMLGQEKSSKAKTRTLGAVEALLLLVEWHPRALHVPPAGDGWDSDLLLTTMNDRDDRDAAVENPSRSRWREDVINPSKRSDQMSWMILGCATSLAIELGLLNVNEDNEDESLGDYGRRLRARRLPLARLLCLFQEHVSLRLDCKPMLPEGMTHAMSSMRASKLGTQKRGEDSNLIMTAWIELAKLERSIADVIFPSSVVTRHLLDTGRCTAPTTPLRDILFVEYQSAKIYTNSLGLQAIVERTIADSEEGAADNQFGMSSIDYNLVQEVLDACLETLKGAIRAADNNHLCFAPVRLFLRITTASVFLLKALGLGVNTSRLTDSLDVLARAITALKLCKPDDLHLGARYAALLNLYVAKLREKFVPATKPPFFATRPGSVIGQSAEGAGQANADWQMDFEPNLQNLDTIPPTTAQVELDESWLSLPLDPSLQPFIPGDSLGFEWLGQNSLDFIWNLDIS